MDHMALTYLHHVPTYIRTAAIQLAMCCSEFRSQGFFFFFHLNTTVGTKVSGNYYQFVQSKLLRLTGTTLIDTAGHRTKIKRSDHALLTQLNSTESTEIIEQDKLKS